MNAVLNSDPIETQFLNFMIENGMKPKNHAVIADGRIHRFEIEGDSAGSKNGAYALHTDGWPAGFAQNYKTGFKENWKSETRGQNFKPFDREAYKAKLAARDKELHGRHEEVARKSAYIYSKSETAKTHPYMEKKGLDPEQVKVSNGSLVIPYQNADGKITTLQFIDNDGNKRFISGGQKKGSFNVIGTLSAKALIITEGWATGMSIHQEMLKKNKEVSVVVAGDAGNLKPVAEALKDKFQQAKFIFAADNDKVGIEKAIEAAKSVAGQVTVPKHGNDWNDFFTAEKKSKALSR